MRTTKPGAALSALRIFFPIPYFLFPISDDRPRRRPGLPKPAAARAHVRAVRDGGHRRRRLGAAGQRTESAGEARRGEPPDRRDLPASGLGRERGDADAARGRSVAARPRAAELLPAEQGRLVAHRSEQAVPARRPRGEARRGQLLSRRRHEGRGRALDCRPAGRRAREGHRLLHDDSPRGAGLGAAVRPRAVQPRISGRARPGRRAVARSRGAHDAADAQGLPDREGGRLPDERLLRERRRVDGARRVHRADDRPVRGLRGRVVQLQGRVRVVHHRAR